MNISFVYNVPIEIVRKYLQQLYVHRTVIQLTNAYLQMKRLIRLFVACHYIDCMYVVTLFASDEIFENSFVPCCKYNNFTFFGKAITNTKNCLLFIAYQYIQYKYIQLCTSTAYIYLYKYTSTLGKSIDLFFTAFNTLSTIQTRRHFIYKYMSNSELGNARSALYYTNVNDFYFQFKFV